MEGNLPAGFAVPIPSDVQHLDDERTRWSQAISTWPARRRGREK